MKLIEVTHHETKLLGEPVDEKISIVADKVVWVVEADEARYGHRTRIFVQGYATELILADDYKTVVELLQRS